MVRTLTACVFVAACLLPLGAHAQSDAEIAAAVVRRAEEAYTAGDFERAAVLLEESLQLYEAPAIHHNLARTLSELSRWEEARTHFRRFLEMSPRTPQRASVEARIAELDRRIARDEQLAEVLPDTRPQENADSSETSETDGALAPTGENPAAEERLAPRNVAPWALLGGGALIALVALPIGVASNGAEDRAAQAATHREGAAELEVARRYARTTNALLVVGGAIGLAALIWAIAKPRRADSTVSFDGSALRVRF